MENKNEVALSKAKFSAMIQTKPIQELINNTLNDPNRASRFIANVSSLVAANPALQRCEAFTIISTALQAEALELPLSPQLGYCYAVPFDEKEYNRETKKRETVRTVATFILGYKGYIQLAIRSGMYADIDAFEIVEGEYLGRDRETGRPRFNFFNSEKERRNKKVIGYVATLELISGFKKVLYWDYDKMLYHADRYSSAFNIASYDLLKEGKIPQNELYKYSSHWYQDFDGMALKTMLRQLISKWGIMSIELQKAFESDTTFTDENGLHYYDNESNDKVIQDVKDKSAKETATKKPDIVLGEDDLPFTTEEPKEKQPETLFSPDAPF